MASKLYFKKIEGTTNRNLICLHNAGGDHSFCEPLAEYLRQEANLFLIDLPGHGKSPPTPSASFDDLADLLKEFSHEHGIPKAYFLGLNNGADLALHVAHRHQDLVSGVIAVDPPLQMDEIFRNEIRQFIEMIDSNELPAFIDELSVNLFFNPRPDTSLLAKNAFLRADRPTLKKTFQALLDWDQSSKTIIQSITSPILFITTDGHHCNEEKISLLQKDCYTGRVIASKCWATLEVPEQVSAMIKDFLKN